MKANESPDISVENPLRVQTMPFRAYQKIYNDWFRNQNVEAEQWTRTVGGLDNSQVSQTFSMRRRMWEKDYYTSCLPFAQRGDAVNIPITESRLEFTNEAESKIYKYPVGVLNNGSTLSVTNTGAGPSIDGVIVDNNSNRASIDVSENHRVVTNIGTINDLRIATRLQRWLEINARVGGRYIEQILGHFGVRSSDARLQRSEYLGGYSAPVMVSEVEQNSATAGSSIEGSTTPQANLAGKASSYTNGKNIKVFCEEHSFIIGTMTIIPRSTYQDGLPKMFQRNYKEDYYFPEFANLGEQEVNKAELFFSLSDSSQRTFDRFGFQERYCEYKYIPSTVHGEFKNNLQFWHLGRAFSAQPSLSKDFVECNPRNRIFAVESGTNHFYVNLINHVTALRPMPKQAIPTL